MIKQDKTLMFDPVKTAPLLKHYLPTVHFTGRFAAATNCARHTHVVPELVLVTEGACRIEVGDQWLTGTAGTLFVLPAHVPQFQHNLHFTRTLYIGFRTEPEVFDTTTRILSVGCDDLTGRLARELCQNQHLDPLTTGGLLLALLSHLNQFEARETTRMQWHPGLKVAVAFLEAHPCDPLTIQEIARHACISPSHLTSLFRREFKCGPGQFQQRLRMDRACRLLADARQSIREVAAECGYEDPNYFARLFRHRFGTSPLEWRQLRASEL